MHYSQYRTETAVQRQVKELVSAAVERKCKQNHVEMLLTEISNVMAWLLAQTNLQGE
jgi:uncharacterized protein YpiB (UPF0302 family)